MSTISDFLSYGDTSHKLFRAIPGFKRHELETEEPKIRQGEMSSTYMSS